MKASSAVSSFAMATRTTKPVVKPSALANNPKNNKRKSRWEPDSDDYETVSRPCKKMRVDRMAKNRKSAHKSRIKKQRERCTLESQVRMLSAQNHALTEALGALTPSCEESSHLREQNQLLMKQLYEIKLRNQRLELEVLAQQNHPTLPKINIQNTVQTNSIPQLSAVVTRGCEKGPVARDSAEVISPQSETASRAAMAEFAMKFVLWQLWMRSLRVHAQRTRARSIVRAGRRFSTPLRPSTWNCSSRTCKLLTQSPYSTRWAQFPRQSTTQKCPRSAGMLLHPQEPCHPAEASHAEPRRLFMAGQMLHLAIFAIYQKWRSSR